MATLFRKTKLFALALVVTALTLFVVATAYAVQMNVWNVSGLQDVNQNCTTVFAVVDLQSYGTVEDVAGVDGYYVILYDGAMNPLSGDDFQALYQNTITETIAVDDFVYGDPVSRPFHLIAYDMDTVFPGLQPPATVEAFPVVASTTFDPGLYSPACASLPLVGGEEPAPVVEVPVPGCDVLIPIPSTAVGAKITADTLAYWAPGQATDTLLKAGTSVRAISQEDGWYKILYACDFLYVPAGTIGPNPESPWFGAPLP